MGNCRLEYENGQTDYILMVHLLQDLPGQKQNEINMWITLTI